MRGSAARRGGMSGPVARATGFAGGQEGHTALPTRGAPRRRGEQALAVPRAVADRRGGRARATAGAGHPPAHADRQLPRIDRDMRTFAEYIQMREGLLLADQPPRPGLSRINTGTQTFGQRARRSRTVRPRWAPVARGRVARP